MLKPSSSANIVEGVRVVIVEKFRVVSGKFAGLNERPLPPPRPEEKRLCKIIN